MRKNQFYINHVSHLKQENDSPLQLNTEECTFYFSIYIFTFLPLFSTDSKFPLLYMLWNKMCAGKKFCATFYEFKVHIFLLKVLLYLLVIFWTVRIDTLYEENGLWKSLPPGEFPPEKFPPIKPSPLENFPPGKLAPRKFSSGLLPFISLIAFLHLTLRFDKFSQT